MFQSDQNLSEYLHEEFVDDEDRIDYDVFATLPKASTTTTTLNDEFDHTATQTLPRSYKIKSDRTVAPMKFAAKARSMSVGELSLENRERGRVQLVVSSDSFVSCTLPRPPKPIRSGIFLNSWNLNNGHVWYSNRQKYCVKLIGPMFRPLFEKKTKSVCYVNGDLFIYANP